MARRGMAQVVDRGESLGICFLRTGLGQLLIGTSESDYIIR